jgi:hypothetical protein
MALAAYVRYGLLKSQESFSQTGHEGLAPLGYASRIGHGLDRINDLIKGLRVNLQDLGMAAEAGDGLIHVPTWNRTDPTEVLAQNEVRIAARQGGLI